MINPRYLETYADPESRAGVLEPEGIVEVKYKEKDLLTTIQRVDTTTINVSSLFSNLNFTVMVLLYFLAKKTNY